MTLLAKYYIGLFHVLKRSCFINSLLVINTSFCLNYISCRLFSIFVAPQPVQFYIHA